MASVISRKYRLVHNTCHDKYVAQEADSRKIVAVADSMDQLHIMLLHYQLAIGEVPMDATAFFVLCTGMGAEFWVIPDFWLGSEDDEDLGREDEQ